MRCRFLAATVLLWSSTQAGATAFGFRDTTDGVGCSNFDIALPLAWPGGAATWFDAEGRYEGPKAFDVQAVTPNAPQRVLRWNVLSLVKSWAGGTDNEGLLITPMAAHGGGAEFHSRESSDIGARPSLRVVHADGSSELLSAVADAALDCSTQGAIGALPVLKVGPGSKVVMRFDLTRLRKGRAADARSAELILVRSEATSWAEPGGLGVYRLATPWSQPFERPPAGIASGFRADVGIEAHPAVVFADRLERARLADDWTTAQLVQARVVRAGDEPGLAPAQPRHSLRVTIPRGENLGLDLRFDFLAKRQKEPQEIYLRYYLRVDPEWMTSADSGKLPGFGGTYGKAGWGGRPWDGQQGWSARGGFGKPAAAGHPAHRRLPLGSYVYHAGNRSPYGDTYLWGGARGGAFIEANRWYCVEQHIRLNTPGKSDGVLRAWVDGQPVFERRGFRLRDTPAIRIENIWMDVYMGGTKPAVRDMTLHIDHVVVATRYIGPMAP